MTRMESNRPTVFTLGGTLLGLMIILGAFLPWISVFPAEGGEEWVTRNFFGLSIHSSDPLLGIHYFPIVGGVLFMAFVALAHKGVLWKIVGSVIAFLIVLLVGYRYLFSLMTTPEGDAVAIRFGLFLTLFASLLGAVVIFFVGKPSKVQREEEESKMSERP